MLMLALLQIKTLEAVIYWGTVTNLWLLDQLCVRHLIKCSIPYDLIYTVKTVKISAIVLMVNTSF